MNYIEQIRGFWRCHEVDVFPTNVIALYFYLLEVNNKTSWMTFFKRNNSKICADLGMTYPTLNIARNRLKQAGLIEFVTKNGSANVTYTLKDFLKVTDEVQNEVNKESSTLKNILKVDDEVATEVSIEVPIEVSSRLLTTKDKLNSKPKPNKNKDRKGDLPFVPPSLDEVKAYFEEKGYQEAAAIRAWDYYEAGEWKDSKGNKVKNWKQKMLSVWFKPEYLKPVSQPVAVHQPGTPIKREMVY